MEKDRTAKINDVEVLERRALVVEDFDEALEAIRALKMIEKTRARNVIIKILNEEIGDVFYQAGAFRELYEISVADAIDCIVERAGTVSPYILGAMLTSVAVDAGYLENGGDVKRAVSALRHALEFRSIEDLQQIQEEKKFFEETFQ